MVIPKFLAHIYLIYWAFMKIMLFINRSKKQTQLPIQISTIVEVHGHLVNVRASGVIIHYYEYDHDFFAGLLPTKDWIDRQVAEFSSLRLKLERHKACLASGNGSQSAVPAPTPKLGNEKGWACFCYGAAFWKKVCDAREDSDSEKKPSKRSKVSM